MRLALFVPDAPLIFFLALAGVMLLLLSALCAVLLFRPWARALLAGAPVTLLALLGMYLRHSNIDAILRARIMAAQYGLDAPVPELERASLAGVDLEALVLSAAERKDRGQDLDWQQLIRAQRSKRLADMQRA